MFGRSADIKMSKPPIKAAVPGVSPNRANPNNNPNRISERRTMLPLFASINLKPKMVSTAPANPAIPKPIFASQPIDRKCY
jgi:hypothetical protein